MQSILSAFEHLNGDQKHTLKSPQINIALREDDRADPRHSFVGTAAPDQDHVGPIVGREGVGSGKGTGEETARKSAISSLQALQTRKHSVATPKPTAPPLNRPSLPRPHINKHSRDLVDESSAAAIERPAHILHLTPLKS